MFFLFVFLDCVVQLHKCFNTYSAAENKYGCQGFVFTHPGPCHITLNSTSRLPVVYRSYSDSLWYIGVIPCHQAWPADLSLVLCGGGRLAWSLSCNAIHLSSRMITSGGSYWEWYWTLCLRVCVQHPYKPVQDIGGLGFAQSSSSFAAPSAHFSVSHTTTVEILGQWRASDNCGKPITEDLACGVPSLGLENALET